MTKQTLSCPRCGSHFVPAAHVKLLLEIDHSPAIHLFSTAAVRQAVRKLAR